MACPSECNAAVQAAVEDAMDGSIDIYDIYDDVCLSSSQARLETQQHVLLGERRRAVMMQQQQQQQQQQAVVVEDGQQARRHRGRRAQVEIGPVFPTCIDKLSVDYLNTPAVQAAIHVKPSTVPNGKWSDCGNVQYDFNYESELPNYKEWVKDGDLQILIYNGDGDYILSHMGNAAWINEGLGLDKASPWTKWRGSDGQVAGYFESYKTAGVPLTFLTVKGAGHMVPKDRPQHALDMFERFLAGGKYDQVRRAPVAPLCGKRGWMKLNGH